MVNTQCISRVPPQRAKPKGRNMTESEKKQVTLGAKGTTTKTAFCPGSIGPFVPVLEPGFAPFVLGGRTGTKCPTL